jgi:cell division protein FtsL
MHTLTLVAACLALSSACLLYGLSYDTRFIEARVQSSERTADRMRSDIAIQRAERAHLSRPERIEPLARAHGLRPTDPSQIVRSAPGRLADAVDDRAR